jgi:succinoglycan biosynthesis transport protein ExoP
VKITETMDEITKKQTELADLFSAREIAETQGEIAALEGKLSDLRSNYATLLSNSSSGAGNTLNVIETANLPRTPVGPRTGMMVLLSAAIAFVISAGAAYLLDYLDDTLKSPEEVTQLLDLPVIGYINEFDSGENYGAYVAKQPRSAVAEAFRSLRTDLEFASVNMPLKTIYVTSTGMSEGKTSVAANLAVILAQSGKNVVLLDADLRKPNVHRTLGLTNQKGLSDVFRSKYDIYEVSVNWRDGNVIVITSGEVPSNPSELLGSKKMDHILASLGNVADVVVIDGPPFLVTDATILANKVDGVLFVIRYGHTRKKIAQEAIKRLGRTEARILGVVLNRIPQGAEEFFGLYNYYHEYYEDEERDYKTSKDGRPRLSLPRIFKRKPETSMDVVGAEEGEG